MLGGTYTKSDCITSRKSTVQDMLSSVVSNWRPKSSARNMSDALRAPPQPQHCCRCGRVGAAKETKLVHCALPHGRAASADGFCYRYFTSSPVFGHSFSCGWRPVVSNGGRIAMPVEKLPRIACC